MASLWTHEFCLGCDKQTDGTAYCSESCRLADFEKTSSSSSTPCSPTSGVSPAPWSSSRRQTGGIYLAPAINFAHPQHATPAYPSHAGAPTLSTSSSNTSLCSLQSNVSSSPDAGHMSEQTKQELHGYAASFDNLRLHRRRSR